MFRPIWNFDSQNRSSILEADLKSNFDFRVDVESNFDFKICSKIEVRFSESKVETSDLGPPGETKLGFLSLIRTDVTKRRKNTSVTWWHGLTCNLI